MSATCPTCGPTTTEQHPRHANVKRCHNCKEYLVGVEQTPDIEAVLDAALRLIGPDHITPMGKRVVRQALAPVLAAAVREARAAELREAADEWQGAFPSGSHYEWVRQTLRDRADRIAVDAPDIPAHVRAQADHAAAVFAEDRCDWTCHCPGRPHNAVALRPVGAPKPESLTNACETCGDCYHPVVGPNTDGDECPWCQECGCHESQHTRMTTVDAPEGGEGR